VALFFGCRRNPGSGCGMTDTRSDSTHPDLFIEAKLRADSPLHKMYAEAAEKATREGKVPILALQWKHHPGWLLVCLPEHIHLLSSLAKDHDGLVRVKEDNEEE